MFEEDLFGYTGSTDLPRKLVIRYGDKAKDYFNSSNKNVKLEQIIEILSKGDWPCFLSKRSQDEFLISIPIENLGGQADLVVSYNFNNYSYELKVSYSRKSKFRNTPLLPAPDFSIPIKANFIFLGMREQYMDLSVLEAMQELKEEVFKLDVPPGMSVEMQQEIWTEYIDAQSQIVDSLSEPFILEGEPKLTSEMRDSGDGVYRYRLDLRLPAKDWGEFSPLQKALQDDLDIEAHIENDGVAFLRYKDIEKGLDLVLKHRFADKYERDSSIGCVLRVRPISDAEKLAEEKPGLAKFFQKGPVILVEDAQVPVESLIENLAPYGLAPASIGFDFHINNISNLYKSDHVEKFGITFSNNKSFQHVGADYQKKEICLPEPINGSTFRLEHGFTGKDEQRFAFFHETLKHIYGEEHVETNVYYRFKHKENEKQIDGFSKEEWNDIYRDIYALQNDLGIEFKTPDAQGGKIIAFDFETKEQLESIYKGIADIKKFHILKSALDDDFLFKVNINLLSKKTEKQRFQEKLKKLNGVEFVYDFEHTSDSGRIRRVPVSIGKLNGYDSTSEHLVIYLPNFFKNDQKETEKFLKFWKEHGSEIDSVRANLTGDRAKLDWLQDAIAKLGTKSQAQGPNGTPVNEKIRDFIFDTSKAEPVFRYENNDIKETPEFKDFDRTSVLKLNDSQKEAVLKGVGARDLCMLQGPPGTGKTTVIAELIWQHIRQQQDTRLLLTSETNLAVDNALEKLMNERAVNPDMARYLSLIKPLRFGKPVKFEEEGKRYSIERIEKWVDDASAVEDDYDSEILGEENVPMEEEEVVIDNPDDNIVQLWMKRIADRSQAGNPRYAEVLKDWVIGLVMPDTPTKKSFRDLYYQHVNVVGSTCSSTGSPGFLMEYLRSFKGISPEVFRKSIKGSLRRWHSGALRDNGFLLLAQSLEVDTDGLGKNEVREAVRNACTITFDTVIMDEASKATPPELLLPLCFGRKSIVIGDHRQLPPMLYEKSFKEALVDLQTKKAAALAEEIDTDFVKTSQFKRMILNPQVSPTIKATFDTQYRMHPDINDVISQFYQKDESGGLHCGLDKDQVNSQDLSNPQSRYHGFLLKGFISPDVHTIWVNVEAPEADDGSSKVNEMEVKAINTVLEKLHSADGFKEYMAHWDKLHEDYKRREEKEIGIISFYGRQVNRISKIVRPRARSLGIQTKINTVDKFQGMERNIVIVSTVRSDKAIGKDGLVDNKSAGFAESPERLNVALSRARRLLIVVGNKKFFSTIKDSDGNYLYRNAIQVIEKQGNNHIIEYSDLLNG